MLLSIIIPTYNKEKVISRCLNSLKKIEEKDVEFIIVNDGSTDDTRKICEKYVESDSRFCLVNQENAGVSSARNTGIFCCSGKYIGFVDADDELTEDFNHVVNFLRENEFQMYGFDYCTQKNRQTTSFKKAVLEAGLNDVKNLYNCFLSGLSNSVCMNIYETSIIKSNHICFNLGMTMGEDCVFNSKYLKHCSEIYYIDKVCYKYYIDDDESATHQRNLSYLADFEKMYQSYMEIYKMRDDLDFPFDYSLYMRLVYGILKKNSKTMTKKQNIEFRSGTFYKVLMARHYSDKKLNFKKIYVKYNLYKLMG